MLVGSDVVVVLEKQIRVSLSGLHDLGFFRLEGQKVLLGDIGQNHNGK